MKIQRENKAKRGTDSPKATQQPDPRHYQNAFGVSVPPFADLCECHSTLAIYIHIPFCRTKCPYCDFVSRAIPGGVPEIYLDALCREISEFAGPGDALSVYIGGGTPSLLSQAQVSRLFKTIYQRFRLHTPEITLEANSDDVTPDLVHGWRDLGINRVSLGVQSFDDEVLRYLGRRHDAATARRACGIVADVFENWNMDLIFGAPPIEAWKTTLEQCIALRPPHVAAYGLTYETGTPFELRSADAINEEQWLTMYQQAEEILATYDHYEISNYARPGHASKHNLVYWHNEEYAGFGAAAYSFLDGVRSRNHPDANQYIAQPGEKAEALTLSPGEIRVETLIQHFRLRQGLNKNAYKQRFLEAVETDFGVTLAGLKKRGLIEEDADWIRPTRLGFYLNNEIGLALVD